MPQNDPLVGARLGKYKIEQTLGKGGMATVYQAQQVNIRRKVAIKVLPRTFLHDDTFMQRFRQEAEVVAQLEHFHILPIYDYGEDEGVPFIVMRFMDGGTLQDRLREEGPLPWEDVVKAIRQVATALDYAHRRGIIHRDIKPSNIMLDGDGNAYLADFGIARILEGTQNLTGSAIVGTPTYMSPDQSEPGPPTPAMDIYSLGVTLFEMITGRVPFLADTPIGLMMQHVTQPAPSLVDYGVPSEVDAVVQQAMAKDPTQRFSSAEEMADALEDAAKSVGGWDLSAGTISMSGSERTRQSPIQGGAMTARAMEPPATQKRRSARQGEGGISPILLGVGGLVVVGAALAVIFLILSGNDRAVNAALAQTATAETAIAAAATATPTDEPTATATVPPPTPTEAPVETATTAPTDEPTATLPPTDTPEPTPLPASTTLRGVQMLLVPAGEFTMGWQEGRPNERPEHEVYLDAYYLDETEVTNESYMACVQEGGCQEPVFTDSPSQVGYFGLEFYEDYPLVWATWNDAQNYCEWRGGHLPTEAQWEKAAAYDPAADISRIVPWSENLILDAFYANYAPLIGETTEVKTYPGGRSALGFYDMSGNVAEWVWDWYQDNYYEVTPSENPTGPDTGDFKVVRGGSYDSRGNALTTTYRDFLSPNIQDATIGFRCAFTPSGGPNE